MRPESETPMRFGIFVPHFGPLASVEGTAAVARRAEELGYHSIWTGDHIAYPKQYIERFGANWYEVFTVLGYLAAVTQRVKLGTAIVVVPYRNPIVLAKMLATADCLSAGRLIFGAGVGWTAEEYAALRAPYEDRGPVTDEYLQVARELFTSESPRFNGRFYQFSGIHFAPKPVQKPHPPIWIGGVTRRAVRRAAEHGTGWIPIFHKPTGRGFDPDGLRFEIGRLHDLAAKAGRAGVQFEICALMPLAFAERALSEAEDQPLVGTPQRIQEYIGRYRDAGLTQLIVNPFYGLPADLLPRTTEDYIRVGERFAREVMPHFAT